MLEQRRISHSLLCGVLFSLASISLPGHASELVLRDEALAQTAGGRSLLKYVVNCALPEGVTVVTTVGGERFTYPGKMGLAPAWSTRALTDHEERLVSSCLLARTNRFGVPVEISSRNYSANPPVALRADDEEKAKFQVHEGGFFGNLFKEDAEAYVCTSKSPHDRQAFLERLRRECALASATPNRSRCNFVIVGDCDDRPFKQNGVDYSDEVIHVYLPAPR